MGRIDRYFLTAFFLIAIIAPQAMATNGHQNMGVGAYGDGMGGAVTAAPFTTGTMVTNPAGIAKIGARTDMDFSIFQPVRTVDFKGMGGESTEGGSPIYMIPALGMSGPTSEGSDLFFGIGMFLPAGFGVDYDAISAGPVFGDGRVFSQLLLFKVTPTVAKRFNDKLSVGFSLNIDYQALSLKEWFPNAMGGALGQVGVDLGTPIGAMGYGFAVGVLYDVNDRITFGVSYTSEQSFSDMEYALHAGDVNFPIEGLLYTSTKGQYNVGLNFPQQYAVGAAFKATDALLITADVKIINYSSTMDQIDVKGNFNTLDTTTFASGTASSMPLKIGWSDQTVFALGIQYHLNDDTWLRIGYNHGESPIKDEDVELNWAFPAVIEDHYTFGATRNLGENWQVNFSFVTAPENTVSGKGRGAIPAGSKISLGGNATTLGVSYRY